MMRLVTVTNYFERHRGGVEIVAGRLVRGLAQAGLQVCWLAGGCDARPDPDGFRAEPLSVWNVTERRLGFPFPLIGLGAMLKIVRAVSAADIVLLHDSLCMPSLCAFLAAKLLSKPVVVVQHIGEIAYRNPLLRTLLRIGDRLLARPILQSADQVVFISATTQAFYGRLRFRSAPRLIFNGVDAGVFQPGLPARLKAPFGLPPRAPVALFVGRFVAKKGLDLVRRVAEMRPDVSWVLAGWGPIDPEDWRLGNVRVVRDRSGAGLADLYRSSDLLVLPSYGEGFPLVIQEALACGLPVICGAETVAADPQAASWLEGVAVDGDPAEAAQAISEALDRVLVRGRGADAARSAFAQQRYAWSEAVARYVELFHDLTAGERRPASAVRTGGAAMAKGA